MIKFLTLCSFTAILIFPVITFAGPLVPNNFSAGDVVSASKMNENFSALENAITSPTTSIQTTIRETASLGNYGSTYGSEVITSTCRSDEQLTGGSCACSATGSSLSTTNWGTVHSCHLVNKTVIGSCWSESLTTSESKKGPAITVYAVCAKNSGTSSRSIAVSAEMSTEAMLKKEEIEQLQQDLIEQMEKQ